MCSLPVELIDIIFSQIPIKTCRLMNKLIKNLTDKRFIDSIGVTKEEKMSYYETGQPLFTYVKGLYKWYYYTEQQRVSTNKGHDVPLSMQLDHIDMNSIYCILKDKNYNLPKDFAKNKVLSILNKTIMSLYINKNDQRADKEFYYCWLITNAVGMGLMDIECLNTIDTNIASGGLNITSEQNLQ